MIDVSRHRHPKESTYFAICAIFSVLVYLGLLIGTVGTILLFLIPVVLMSWFYGMFFGASVLGNAVKITPRQYPAIKKLIDEVAAEMNIAQIPEAFVVNGNGVLNAFAIRFIGRRYVILYANIVDMALKRDRIDELKAIIAHELGHHAAGHTSLWRGLLIQPAMFIPYLGFAYSRACEYTCDRLAVAAVKDGQTVGRALVALGHGSEALASNTDLAAFLDQEQEIPKFAAYVNEIYSTHPRLTRRVNAVIAYAKEVR